MEDFHKKKVFWLYQFWFLVYNSSWESVMTNYIKNLAGVSIIILFLTACPAEAPRRAELTLAKVASRIPLTLPTNNLPDENAEYGIVTDMDGDGLDELVLVYFEGSSEKIDHYVIALFVQKGNEWIRSDYLDSKDPKLPSFFAETTPDLPPRLDLVPVWFEKIPPRGEGWTGESLNLWKGIPLKALPFAELDGKKGNEVIIPMTGFDAWYLLVLSKDGGYFKILEDVKGMTLKGSIN